MSFVRVKKISGTEYGYLVENSWTDRGARQRVGKYLGKVFRFSKAKSESLAGFLKISDVGRFVKSSDFSVVAAALVRLEMQNHDVKESEFLIDFDAGGVKNLRGKDVVIAMNEGFLCSYTLKRLLEYKPEEDYSGFKLADFITAAGIVPEQDVFVEIFGKFKTKYEEAAAKRYEIYY